MNKLLAFMRRGVERLRSFGRTPGDGAEAAEPAPPELADTVVDTPTDADASPDGAEARPSLWSRLLARFGKREGDEAGEAAVEAPEAEAEGEAQEKGEGWWPLLLARLSLRKRATGDEGEAAAESPAGRRAEHRADAGKGAGRRGGARAEAAEDEAAAAQPGRGGIRGLLARKPVWISLIGLAVAGISAAGWFAGEAYRARSDADAKMLQQRNQALAEQNRKLQAENAKLAQPKNKPQAPMRRYDAAADPIGQPGAGNGGSAGRSDNDCTVNDAASVRDTLKGCIEGFNAGSGG